MKTIKTEQEKRQDIVDLAKIDGVDLTPYNNLFVDEMNLVRLGLKRGLDVAIFAQRKYDIGQMEQIYYGLYDEVDVTQFNNVKYTYKQMQSIRWGLREGLDVSTYADTKLEPREMEKIRLKLYYDKNNQNFNLY